MLPREKIYLQAIESGRLPGDILDDIPCKFVDGTIVCEVIIDYRIYLYQCINNLNSTYGSKLQKTLTYARMEIVIVEASPEQRYLY